MLIVDWMAAGKTRHSVQIICCINSNFNGADDHMIWLETNMKVLSTDENDKVFMASQQNMWLLLQQIKIKY